MTRVKEQTAEDKQRLREELSHHPGLKPSGRLSDATQGKLSPDDFIKSLGHMIESNMDACTGAFYRALFEGRVSQEGAQIWISQWYYEARAFIPLLGQVLANADFHYDVRQTIGKNLFEELGEFAAAKEHPQILKKIGMALGLTEEQIEFVEPIPEVLVFTEYQRSLVHRGNLVEAIAAGPLYHEWSIPGRYPKIGEALKRYFNVSHEALEFLWIHAGDPTDPNDYGGDVEHTKEAVMALKKYAVTEGLQQQARLALWKSLQAGKVYNLGLYRAAVLELDPQFSKQLYR